MTCLEFHRDPYNDGLRTCTLELTLQELKILNNALHFYCNEDGHDLLIAHELHKDLYGVKNFIEAGRVYDDGVLNILDEAIKKCKEQNKQSATNLLNENS